MKHIKSHKKVTELMCKKLLQIIGMVQVLGESLLLNNFINNKQQYEKS